MRQLLASIIGLAICAATAAGCGSASSPVASADAASPRHGGSLVVSVATEPPVINPWLAPGAQTVTWMLFDGLNDPLIRLDDQGRWQPVLAQAVPTRANGGVAVGGADGPLTVRVTLRREASWSDGVPLRCNDVAFTWKTVTNPDYQMGSRLGWDQLDRVECPSPLDVVLRFKRPYAMYKSRILALGPLPEHVLAGKDFNTFWNDRVTVSSGPFLFREWQRGVRLVLVRNDHYWNAGPLHRPFLDRLVFRFVKDANTLKMQLRMSEADAAVIPPDTNLAQELRQTPDVRFTARPLANTEQLAMNTESAALHDVNVRIAVAYAIDREQIARVALKGQVQPAQSVIVPVVQSQALQSFARYRADPAKVRQYMQAAGYVRRGQWWTKAGKPLVLHYVTAAGSVPVRARVAQLLQQQLEAQGMQMDIQLIAPEVLYGTVTPHGKFDLGEWSEPTGVEPTPALLLQCDQVPRAPRWAGKDRARYCNPQMDALLHAADGELDETRRAALVRQVDELVARDVPILPLFQPPDTVATTTKVHGMRPSSMAGDGWNVDDWWLG